MVDGITAAPPRCRARFASPWVTCLMPTIRRFGSNSIIRSTSSNGYRCGRIRSIGGMSINFNRVYVVRTFRSANCDSAPGAEYVVPERTGDAEVAFRLRIMMLHVIAAEELSKPRLHVAPMDDVVRQVIRHIADRDAGADRVDITAKHEAEG